ncbi:Rid family detoxifying hydrolase [Flavobacterium aquidurense]|uniref:Ribonuc L-PSP multi-domain protein n=1 Tax=Flavobacterium aquidurense TaxID=362413 RepID=A0A0Q0WDV2_9FLAO|nr:Rid family detoxifying hydrolase [Flavobacterium aquidurense]KQB42493.1 Ribonuc L-PSP multi-domain protein [Flavobacterium aquidurense]
MSNTQQSEKTVRDFLEIVRSGKDPERAAEFMSESVKANQLNSEHQEVIMRTPANYSEHVKDFIKMYGNYKLEITELIANGDKVYARWEQLGKQMTDIDNFKATELPVTIINHATFRISKGKIVEYWIATDRKGTELQLQANEKLSESQQPKSVPYSDAVKSGDNLYISGQLGLNHTTGKFNEGDFESEAKQAMDNIGLILNKQGLTFNNLVNVTIYLTNMGNYNTINKIYSTYFQSNFPARICIAVKELPRKGNIEIAAVANFKK